MTTLHKIVLACCLGVLVPHPSHSQYIQKISLNTGDSTDYYLAIPPLFGKTAGALVILVPFGRPEFMLPETRLHNIASVNKLLTIYASIGNGMLPGQQTLHRVGDLLAKVSSTWHINADNFALGGNDLAGTVALRYA
ncbi:MAG TPA: hypothetical protein VNU72_09420, partial [Puia sp.]|nr:hypothetical protein [Puia sp.]